LPTKICQQEEITEDNLLVEKEKNKQTVLKRFSRALQAALIDQFGKGFSAQRLANEFNLRASGTTTITRQTALNWITGRDIPNLGRLYVLKNWLNLDLNEVFSSGED
jgi:hypothetical protein